jgi:diguanylate cyclase (GGDEF)-like protein
MILNEIPEPDGWDDALTGLEGPAFWERVLIAEVARSTKYDRPLTVVVIELQGIDAVWEADGPEVARRIFREAAECLRRAARASDYCTRIAPGRFGVILTETDEISAINFVERVREDAPRFLPDSIDGLRLRFGWASPMEREAPDSLVRRAERRLLTELTHPA